MTQRRQYRITNPADLNDLANQLNAVLTQMADRLDQIEGYRGTPTFQGDVDLKGNRIINAGTAVTATDVATLAQAGGAGADHGTLIGLTDDDHTQYAKLTGRGGGQILQGGTAASNNLTLQSTTNATKGAIKTGNGDGLEVYDAAGTLIHGFQVK